MFVIFSDSDDEDEKSKRKRKNSDSDIESGSKKKPRVPSESSEHESNKGQSILSSPLSDGSASTVPCSGAGEGAGNLTSPDSSPRSESGDDTERELHKTPDENLLSPACKDSGKDESNNTHPVKSNDNVTDETKNSHNVQSNSTTKN